METNMLKKKDKLQTADGRKVTVLEFIGDGGQGEVYRVQFEGKEDFALKWYFPHASTKEQQEILKILIEIGPPNNRFLWPVAMVNTTEKSGCFGYLMPFRPNHYKTATGMLSRKIEPTFKALMTACFQLSDSFLQLHSKGLSYRDISINNIFIDPVTGDILICDNDNVAYEGISYSGVAGTPAYMAPEIVRNESTPNRDTDLYSLSVLLFFLNYIAHPLDGKREASIHAKDEAAFKMLYGTHPLYIFHPTDRRNEPDPEIHSNALAFNSVLPKVLKDTFERAFTAGLNDPAKRVEESLWRNVFVSIRDTIFTCDKCGAEVFYDIEKVRSQSHLKCWCCNTVPAPPARIRINNDIVLLDESKKLFPHHTNGILYNFTKPTAEISFHPTIRKKGLKNLSSDTWYFIRADKSVVPVEPGRSFFLESGTAIKFGLVQAEIRV
ncbi:MAG: serine/threonine-protein kinase [Bacteroidota bacterium]